MDHLFFSFIILVSTVKGNRTKQISHLLRGTLFLKITFTCRNRISSDGKVPSDCSLLRNKTLKLNIREPSEDFTVALNLEYKIKL